MTQTFNNANMYVYTSRICKCALSSFQPLILHKSNTKLTVHKGVSIPWLRPFPKPESLSSEGGGGGLGGVSLGNGGINLQLSFAGSNVTAPSTTRHGQFSKIPIILYLKLSIKHYSLNMVGHSNHISSIQA